MLHHKTCVLLRTVPLAQLSAQPLTFFLDYLMHIQIQAFLDSFEANMDRLLRESALAQWGFATNITDETEQSRLRADTALTDYIITALNDSLPLFADMAAYTPEQQRQLMLLRLLVTRPRDAALDWSVMFLLDPKRYTATRFLLLFHVCHSMRLTLVRYGSGIPAIVSRARVTLQ